MYPGISSVQPASRGTQCHVMQEIQRVLHGVDRSRPLLVLFSAPEHEARATRPLPARLSGGQRAPAKSAPLLLPHRRRVFKLARRGRSHQMSRGMQDCRPNSSWSSSSSPCSSRQRLLRRRRRCWRWHGISSGVPVRRSASRPRLVSRPRGLSWRRRRCGHICKRGHERQRPAVAGCVGSHRHRPR